MHTKDVKDFELDRRKIEIERLSGEKSYLSDEVIPALRAECNASLRSAGIMAERILEQDGEIGRLTAALAKIANDNYTPEDWDAVGGKDGMAWENVARRAISYEQTPPRCSRCGENHTPRCE